jgi:hypothetical protein
MQFKFIEPGGITAFGVFISSDEWTEVTDKDAANKLRNNSHFECKGAGSKASPEPSKADDKPSDATETPRRRRRTKAAAS